MKRVKVEQVNMFLWRFNNFIITEFIISDINMFEEYNFPKNSVITNLQTINAINKNKKALRLLSKADNISKEALIKRDNKGNIRAKEAPISELLLLFKQSKQNALYITNNEKDYKEKYDFITKNKITNISVVIYQKGNFYIALEKDETPIVPVPKPKVPKLDPDASLPTDDDLISFSINLSFDASSVEVVLRNEKTFSSSTKHYLKRGDQKTYALKQKDNEFIYRARFSDIKYYSYLIIIAKVDEKVYSTTDGIYINYYNKNYEYIVDIKGHFLDVHQKRKFDENISNDELFIKEDKRFDYFGGKLLPPIRTSNKTIKIPEVNNTVNIGSPNGKRVVQIGKNIGSGKEGTVYLARNNPNIVVKIYKNETLNKNINKENAIKYFLAKKIDHPYIAWPSEILYYQGNFVGFAMKKAKGDSLYSFVMGKKGKEAKYNSSSKLEIVELIIKILEIFRYLHAHNVVVGDIKPQNFIYDATTKEICLVDLDSVQVGQYCEKLTSKGYTPPETEEKAKMYNTFAQDNFSIFSLIFYLLAKQTPYWKKQKDHEIETKPEDRAKMGDFALDGSKAYVKERAPNIMDSMWVYLPGYLREAFINVASKNGKNFSPENRLSPSEWLTLFKQYKKDLQNGRLRKITPNTEKGVFMRGLNDPLVAKDFKNVYEEIGDLQMDDTIIRTFKGLRIEELINSIFRLTNIKNISRTLVVNEIINNSVYDSTNLKIEVIKDLGIMYELAVYYKP